MAGSVMSTETLKNNTMLVRRRDLDEGYVQGQNISAGRANGFHSKNWNVISVIGIDTLPHIGTYKNCTT